MMTDRKPIVVITGASSGFGKLTALKLLEEGCTVYGGAPDTEPMAEIEAAGGTAIALDVRDDASARSLVDTVIAREGRIDVLFNNAGYGQYGFVECVAMDDIQRQFDVNVFGYARMLQAVLPHMRSQRSGRIINTASVVSHVSVLGFGWYAATKHAILAMTEALRMEVEGFGIHVVEIEPGSIATGFQKTSEEAMQQTDYPPDYAELHEKMLSFVKNSEKHLFAPESTVEAMVHAATADNPKDVYRTTLDAKLMPVARGLLSTHLWSALNRKMVGA